MKNKEIWRIPIACVLFIGIIAVFFTLRTGIGPVAITNGVVVTELDFSDTDRETVKVNINTADALLLTRLPGIGTTMAERIIAFRNENGPFEKIEDIMKVFGIGEKRFENLSGLISVTD